MTCPVLWQIAVESPPEHESAVADILTELFQLPASSYTAVDPPLATISVYSPNRPGSQIAVAARIIDAIQQRQARSQNPIPFRVSIRRLPNRDWTAFWKGHFKPLVIDRSLLVLPPWIRRRPKQGQKRVVLNPGLSFGTGHHPTTAFCLRQLARLHRRPGRSSLLDLGCGSGILAIAAAKLGYRPVEAIDADPVAVRIASTNARRNRVQHRVAIRQQDLRRLLHRPQVKFDVVCANLTADLLLSQGSRIVHQLQTGGYLVLAGILTSEFPTIERCFTDLGLQLDAQQSGQEWHSGLFRDPA
jgi:ribosomal protein L11 methyltransferase